MKRSEIRLPDDLHAWLVMEAARARLEGRGESQNDIIVEALKREKERREAHESQS